MELFENRRCPCVFVTVYDNTSKCVLKILQLAHVETGQTSGLIKLIKVISRQDSSPICQILSNPPEIMHLNEA